MWTSRSSMEPSASSKQSILTMTDGVIGRTHRSGKGRPLFFLVVSAFLLGVSLFSLANHGPVTKNSLTQVVPHGQAGFHADGGTFSASSPQPHLEGAGGIGEEPTAQCSSPNPLDPTCWAQLAAKAMAQ